MTRRTDSNVATPTREDPPVEPVFLSIGSNERPESRLPAACDALRQLGTVVSVSRVYESQPVPPGAGPNYLNAAVKLLTTLDVGALKDALRRVERALGRDRARATVALDLDICLYGAAVIRVDGKTIVPHPALQRRAFMAVPVAECDPLFRHPETGETLDALALRVRRSDAIPLRLRPDLSCDGCGTSGAPSRP